MASGRTTNPVNPAACRNRSYIRNMMANIDLEYTRRREAENSIEDSVVHPETKPLSVELGGFYPRENAREHKTDMYELVLDEANPTPVFRRGLPFYFASRFDRKYDPNHDNIQLEFTIGPRPFITKGTRVVLPVTDRKELSTNKNRWDVCINSQSGKDITLQVHIPATAQVGIWQCKVLTSHKGNDNLKNNFLCKESVYVLFNPWCQDDAVYLENEGLRKECVLNETGKVWCGTHLQPKGRRWIFGQFDDTVLPGIMYLLELSKLKHADRGNPVQMVRTISAIINSNDEDGLLRGRWDGAYEDGTAPHMWTGSVAIFDQYLKNGGQPVQYGQCWVYSAVAVTVCRALGIPCRSVTNYVSAHDTDATLTVDTFFTKSGDLMEGGPDGNCSDSCWNFHVWNEVWMARHDLPAGYGGWQVIDATPQEESDAIFRCGPASVVAVRKGEVGFSYDTPFVFSEVNADLYHFQEDDKSYWGFSRMRVNKYHVGRKIVTKRHDMDDDEGDADLEDITDVYKNPEGSEAERLAVFNAVRGTERAQKYYEYPRRGTEDVFFDLVEIDKVPYGENFSVIVHIQNKSDKPRTIIAILSASSVFYTGATAHMLKKAQKEFVINPKQRETLQITVTASEYLGQIVDKSLVKIYALANVKETKQTWSEEDDFPLLKPPLLIEVRGKLQVGQTCQAAFSFQNPLLMPLTDCVFSVEGPGLQRPKFIKYRDVQAGELVSFTEHFSPKKSGERKIVGAFNSKQLTEVLGSVTVNIAA